MHIYDFLINNILPKFESFGYWGYAISFTIAFLESIAFIGAILPGSTVIVIIGFLSSQGILNIWNLLWIAALGAMTGDCVSYYLGTKGKRFFPGEGRLLKRDHLERAEYFFKKHGGKSIFLARFIGPLRPIVPFVAGFSKMNLKTFLFWNLSSAVLWAVSHLVLGYFLGSAIGKIAFWSKWVSIIGGIIFISIITWFISRSTKASVLKEY
ncbi:MAG: DedA family protein [Minisyncoccia bacterium]